MAEYRFLECPDGFRIEGAGSFVTVRLQPWVLLVSGARDRDEQPFGLLSSLAKLSRRIAGMLSPPPRANSRPQAGVVDREAWAIAPELSTHLVRLREKVDPTVLAVHHAAHAVSRRVPAVAGTEALYREPYLVRDILNYRAATIAFALLEHELWPHFCQGIGRDAEPTPELVLEDMRNWRGLYSPSGRPYRSLNRTLMNLPHGIGPGLLCQLRTVELRRPMLDALELATLVLRASTPGLNPEAMRDQIDILQFATATEIRAALARVGEYTERRLSPRRCEDVRFLVQFLGDYPQRHHGRLGGLVERAIRWHRHVPEEGGERALATLGGRDRSTARPPIPLPKIAGITFLATVGAIAAEGRRMTHCIATYAERAVTGHAYLFHVEHAGHVASVEVDAKGAVRQAAGPRNTSNPAVTWGREQLRSWGMGLRQQPRPRATRRVHPAQLELPFAADG